MKKKLTLRMEQDAIERAKAYAKERGTSVSKLVEQFFCGITREEDVDEVEMSPLVRALLGVAEGADMSEEDYYEYLEKKHR